MPHLTYTYRAIAGMRRCTLYLWERSPTAAKRARQEIKRRLNTLKRSPYLGRPYDPEEGQPDKSLRELIIKGGYLALYRYNPEDNEVRILAFKHGSEAQYY